MFNSFPPIKERGTIVFKSFKTFLFFCQSALVIVVSVLLYLNTIGNNFVYDDKFTITNNYLIRSWLKVPAIFTGNYFVESGELSYRPIVTLSYFFDYSIWRLNSIGYHLTNLLLHSLNAIFLFFMCNRIFNIANCGRHKELDPVLLQNSEISSSKSRAVKIFVPFIVSLVFCTHPLLTEAVNAISYREDLLAATFYLAAFLFYLITCERRTSKLWYAISLFCYFMGLFSKESSVTFPILIVLFDFLHQGKARLAYNLIHYYAGYILVSIFYILFRFVFLHNPMESYTPYPHDSLWINFLTMPKVVASYIKIFFFPVHLNADYVVPNTFSPTELSFILPILLIISVAVIVYRLFFSSKIVSFSILWFFVALLPVMNIIPIENIMAERYLYIPIMGFCILASYLLSLVPSSGLKNSFMNPGGFVFIVTIILIGFSWQSCQRAKIWFNDFSLWSATVERSPESSRAHNNLGVLYKNMGFVDAAIQEYNKAIQIRPDYSEAHGNLANVYMDKGFNILDKQILPKTDNNLARAYVDEGYLKDAITEYKKSIEISPVNETAHFNLGVTYGKLGFVNDAEIEYENVIRINNKNPHAHNNLGNIYEDRGLLERAMTEYKHSVSIDPDNAITHNNIGNVYFKKDVLDEAIQEYRLATKNNPMGIVFHENLGNTYLRKGLIDEAINEFELIVNMEPKNSNHYINLIMLYWNYKKDGEKAVFYLKKLSDLLPDQKESVSKMIEKLGIKK